MRRPLVACLRLGLVAALALAGCSDTPEAPERADPPSAPGLLVSSVGDPHVRLAERAPSGRGGEDVVVRTDAPAQEWQGVGAALTDDTVDQLAGRPDLVALLVDPAADRGARLDWLRLPLTATDHSTTDWAWAFDASGTVTPPPQAWRALDLLREEVLPLAPDLRLVATPWTAPPTMKEPATWNGGRLRPDAVASYADLLVGQARWLVEAGYPLAAMTLGNEPGLARDDYPTMTIDDDQLAELARRVGPALSELGVDLWALDHNWADRPRVDTALAAAPGEYDGVAFHCYEGEPEQAAGLAVPWLVSECTGTTAAAADTVAWDLDVLVDRAVDAGSSGLLMWNAVLGRDVVGRPGGCADCRGLLTAGPDPVAEPEFYVLAHLARAAAPGDRVLPVSGPADLPVVAFRHADGAVGLVGHNPTDRPRDLVVRQDEGEGSGYRIGPHELFTWTSADPARE